MSRSFLPLAALCLLAAGCGGGSYCKKSAKLAEDCGEELSDADIEACEEMLEGCSASDEKKLSDFTDCITDGGSFCEDETMTTGDMEDMMSMFACFAELEGISEECGAMTMGGTTTFTGSWTTTPPTTSR